MTPGAGTVYLVGAGPGDPELITWRGLELLRRAEVVVYDRLAPPELLREAPATADLVDVGKTPGEGGLSQAATNHLLVSAARQGKTVVRLKGGDPFVFGRGQEELDACRAAGVPWEVVPGVTSAVAGPAAAGIPLTARGLSRGFAVVTARCASEPLEVPADSGGGEPNWAALAQLDTVVVLMGRARLGHAAAALIAAGRPAKTPAAVVENATTGHQRVVRADLAEIAHAADAAAIGSPALLVVGATAALARPSRAAASPLAGYRVVVTRPRTAGAALTRLLVERGARATPCPLITIDPLDPAGWSGELPARGWLVFTSRHGVRGLWRALRRRGRDARAFAGLSLAAVGPGTASELHPLGLTADFVPSRFRAAALVEELAPKLLATQAPVLFVGGTLARPELTGGLRACGVEVDELIVYHTRPVAPTAAALRDVAGADVWTFHSPSAVESYVAAGLANHPGALACLGETTARRARELGLTPSVVAAEHHDAGLVASLEAYFGTGERAA